MYNPHQTVRYFCRGCSRTLLHLRSFQSVSEARDFEGKTSALDRNPSKQKQDEVAWLPYLSSNTDLDIQETIDRISGHVDKSRALQIILTRQFHQRSWEELKEVISNAVRDDPNSDSNYLTGLLTHFSLG